MRIEIKFNKKYIPILNSKTRYNDIWGGRGRGGSHFGIDKFLFKITQPKYFRGYFIRQVFSDIRDSLFSDFLDHIEKNDTLDIDDFSIDLTKMKIVYKPTGNVIISKGIVKSGNRTAKLKSLSNATDVLIEEADEISQEDFDQLDLSLRTMDGDIDITRIFNPPPKRHWIWRDYILEDIKINFNNKDIIFCKAKPKENSNLTSVFGTYHDNIKNIQKSTIVKMESFKEVNPEYYYNQVLGLISEGSSGRIYYGWESISDDEFELLDYPYVYAIDFGYSNHPTALLQIKYNKNERFCKELIYEPGLLNYDLAKKMESLGINNEDIIVADPGAGGDVRIAELRRGWDNKLFFNIHPSTKGQGSIKIGINLVKECKNFVTENSKNMWNEYSEYKWCLNSNKEPTDVPFDDFNHLMDCRRYFELNKGRLY